MAFPVPRSLSPSKVSSFTDCALAFRFSVIDKLPEPPSPAATKGTLVHAALERLHLLPPAERTLDAALGCLDEAAAALRDDPEYTALGLSGDDEAAFRGVDIKADPAVAECRRARLQMRRLAGRRRPAIGLIRLAGLDIRKHLEQAAPDHRVGLFAP